MSSTDSESCDTRVKIDAIAIISASGIGNTILFTPALYRLRKEYPKAKIDLLVGKKVFGDCVGDSELVDDIIVIPSRMFELIRFFSTTRKRYDVSITVFPSNKWQFNLFAWLLCAKLRITHGYTVGRLRTLSFLQNIKVAVDSEIHDVYQNLNLLRPLSVSPETEEPRLFFHLSCEDEKSAESYLSDNQINHDDFVLGVHAGAGPIGDKKKWGLEKFAVEIQECMQNNPSCKVMLFGGEEENEERIILKKMINSEKVYLYNGTLGETAALIRRCNYFLSNDTGLMHIAACFGIRQKAIFIATNPDRTRPFNANAVIQIEGDCSRYGYPFRSTK